MTPFRQAIKPGDSGLDVLAVKRALRKMGAQDSDRLNNSRKAGASFVHVLKAVEHNRHLREDGIYGPKLHTLVAPHFDRRGVALYLTAKKRSGSRQIPPLPAHWGYYGNHSRWPTRWGVHPCLEPQVEAICKEFGLVVTAGWASHGHAGHSDHYWGGACDFAGPYQNMVNATFWADSLRGSVFRWVGGPAHDSDGVEHGHGNHLHTSWFRDRPTTIFGTARFH